MDSLTHRELKRLSDIFLSKEDDERVLLVVSDYGEYIIRTVKKRIEQENRSKIMKRYAKRNK